MDRVDVDDVANEARTADVTKHLTDPLSLSDAALNYYELAPGDSFSGGMHAHTEQEEMFFVLAGTATFETPDGTFEVGPDEAVRFAPGEYQEGRNEGDERVRALALGAPQEMGETRVPLPCEACGEADYHLADVGADGVTLRCPSCGNEIET